MRGLKGPESVQVVVWCIIADRHRRVDAQALNDRWIVVAGTRWGSQGFHISIESSRSA